MGLVSESSVKTDVSRWSMESSRDMMKEQSGYHDI